MHRNFLTGREYLQQWPPFCLLCVYENDILGTASRKSVLRKLLKQQLLMIRIVCNLAYLLSVIN
jgi:hypothetical protein